MFKKIWNWLTQNNTEPSQAVEVDWNIRSVDVSPNIADWVDDGWEAYRYPLIVGPRPGEEDAAAKLGGWIGPSIPGYRWSEDLSEYVKDEKPKKTRKKAAKKTLAEQGIKNGVRRLWPDEYRKELAKAGMKPLKDLNKPKKKATKKKKVS